MEIHMFSTTASLPVRVCHVTALGTVVLVMLVGCTGGIREPQDLSKTLGRLQAKATFVDGRIDVVSFRETAVSDADLACLAGQDRLRILELYGTSISDVGLRLLTNLPTLQELGLSKTRVTADGLRHVATFPRLQSLYLIQT